MLSSLALLWPSPPAVAHGVLIESTPRADEAARDVKAVTLRFNSRVEPAFSQLRLTGPSGELVPLQATPSAAEPNRVAAALPPLGPGTYTVHWRILTVDGHVTHGSFRFQLHERR